MNKTIVIIPLAVASFFLVSPFVIFLGNDIMVITSDSMFPALKQNDLIIVKPSSIDEINQGDIIAFDSHMHGVGIIAHRAIDIYDDDGQIAIHTKGDNNPFLDPWVVHDEDLIGKVIQIIPSYGVILDPSIRLVIMAVIVISVISLLIVISREKKPKQ